MEIAYRQNHKLRTIQLQYIRGNGKAAILTGMAYDKTHTYEVKFQTTYDGSKSNQGYVFGNTVCHFLAVNWYENRTVQMDYLNAGQVSFIPNPYNAITRFRLHDLGVEFFYDDDIVPVASGQTTSVYGTGLKFAILGTMNYTYGTNASSPDFIRIYSVKEWDGNGNLISDLIPVRIGHEGYMLDLITGIMHGNYRDHGNGLPIECLGPDLLEDE